MKPVTNHYQHERLWQNYKTTLRSFTEPASKAAAGQVTGTKDLAELTDPASTEPKDRIQKLLDELTKNFPGISFEIVPDGDYLNLKEKAASLGYGKHLLISESFLRRMESSEKDYQDCKSMLLASVLFLAENKAAGVFLGEKQATSWSIKDKAEQKDPEAETLAQMLQSLKEAKNNSKIRFSGNVSYETGELYRKLARAGDKALIQSVISETYQNMGTLRLISCLGEDKERAKAQKAIRSLQRLVVRSRQKMRHLDKEELIKLKKIRAAKRQEEEKVRELQKELKKKQAKRMRLDKRILEEGDKADLEIRRLKQYLAHVNQGEMLAAGAVGAVTLTGARGPGDMKEQLPSHVDELPPMGPRVHTTALISMHSPMPHKAVH